MIRHIVLTKFKPGTGEDTIAKIYAGLAAVTDRLPGAHNFTGGRSESPERIERGYGHGFVIDFDSWDALKTYSDDEEHKAFGAQLVANAVGGIDGILVLDINVG
ncbi:MAG: Dabb family protein [Pseudomonadota bacterium]